MSTQGDESENESQEVSDDEDESQNNNATKGQHRAEPPVPSTSGWRGKGGTPVRETTPPRMVKNQPNLMQSVNLMQEYMLYKGLINESLNDKDMEEFLDGVASWSEDPANQDEVTLKKTPKTIKNKKRNKETNAGMDRSHDSSATTVYRRAVEPVETITKNNISSSSDEIIDTSDELVNEDKGEDIHNASLTDHFIAGCQLNPGLPPPDLDVDLQLAADAG